MVTFGRILFALVFICSCVLRFSGLQSNGIVGSDTFQYWDIAQMWLSGNFVLNNDIREYHQYFRPTFFSLNTLSLILFGQHDYSLKLMMGIFESVSVLLVFRIGSKVLKGELPGALLALCYAAIPSSILLSRIELPHCYTTTFVLAAVYCIVLGQEKRRSSHERLSATYLIILGLFLGLSATTHGSTAFLTPGLGLIVALDRLLIFDLPLWQRVRDVAISGALCFSGFVAPYVLFGALVGYPYMLAAIASEGQIRGPAELHALDLLKKYTFEGPTLSLSAFALYSLGAAAGYQIIHLLRYGRSELFALGSLGVLMIFSVLFSLVFQSVFYPRIYLPMNFFVLLGIFSSLSMCTQKLPVVMRLSLMVLYSGAFVFYTFFPKLTDIAVYYKGDRKGAPRFAYDYIGANISDERRLLVAPYTAWMHRPSFKHPLYFGRNISYLMECGAEDNLSSFAAKSRVKYVYITKEIDVGIPSSPQARYANVGLCTGMNRGTYSLEQDTTRIAQWLSDAKAKLVAESSEYGSLYELP